MTMVFRRNSYCHFFRRKISCNILIYIFNETNIVMSH